MPHPFADFYRGKRVLVTGHTGFEGGWTAAWLKLLGAQVCGYGLPPATRPNFFDATILDRGMTSIFGDIRDRNSLAETFTELQPEIVVHCAAQTSPHHSLREPVDAFSTNVMGTVNLLEEARLTASVRAMVLLSSAASDAHELRSPANPETREIYRASVASAELARVAFNKSYFRKTGAAVATARVADAIGGGDWREGHVVPDLVRSILSGGPASDNDPKLRLKVWHVLEPVRACLLLAKRLFERGHKSAAVWDFAPGDHDRFSAGEFSEKFIALWNGSADSQENGSPTHAAKTKASAQAAQSELRWEPKLTRDEALAWTVEWYRGFCADPASSLATTEGQIEKYMRETA